MLKLMIFLSFMLGAVPVQDKLVKTKVNDNITVSLPESFYAMTPEDIAQRYPSVRSPIGAYTNEQRMVDFSVNISATQWRPQDIEIAKDFFKASLLNLYDRVDMLHEDIKTIGKRQYIVFEFESRINGDHYSLDTKDPVRTYTYIQYLIVKGKTIVFSFNCPIRFEEQWRPVAPKIMDSIEIKGNI